MQRNLDVLLRLYCKVYSRLQILWDGTRLSDARRAVDIGEVSSSPLSYALNLTPLQFSRYQRTLLSELRRLVLQSESREIKYAFQLLKKSCSWAAEKTHQLLNSSRNTSDEHIPPLRRLPTLGIPTPPEPKTLPQSPRYNRRLLGRKKLRNEATAVNLEKLKETAVKRKTKFENQYRYRCDHLPPPDLSVASVGRSSV
jgi:hypothetical protein